MVGLCKACTAWKHVHIHLVSKRLNAVAEGILAKSHTLKACQQEERLHESIQAYTPHLCSAHLQSKVHGCPASNSGSAVQGRGASMLLLPLVDG